MSEDGKEAYKPEEIRRYRFRGLYPKGLWRVAPHGLIFMA